MTVLKHSKSILDTENKTLMLRKIDHQDLYVYLHYNSQKDSIILQEIGS